LIHIRVTASRLLTDSQKFISTGRYRP